MEILFSIVGTIAEHTVVPIGRQASYLIFYKGNLSSLADSVKGLEEAKKTITHSVEEEKRNGKNIEEAVMNWLEKVDEVIGKANQLENDPRRANARCSAWPFPNLILRHQLSRKATKIVQDVIQVQGKGSFNRIGYLPPLDGETSSSSTRGGEKYETRETFKENIMNALAHHNSCNIGVYGLGGVGKTTLVGEVFEISKKQKLFDAVVKTHVTKNPDIKTIQGEIADWLGLRFGEESVLGRAHRLRQRIKMEKNILIVLDDIWTILDLKKVGIPFGNEHNGCKLLMTSRNQDVLLQMDVPKDFIFKLELMSQNETWSLFQFMAGDVIKDSNLKGVAIQVAQKCAGLPLVTVTVAQALKGKRDVHAWKDALRRLESDHHTIFSALELSYDSLENDEIRDVFLLFALFPDDNVQYFLKVAMGLDILKDIKTVDDARNRLYPIIHSLEATCLLEVKKSGDIEMHDFVRDFAISIARRDKHVFLKKQSDEEFPTKSFLTRCTQVVLDDCMHELPQMIDCPNIKFFFLSSENLSLEVPDNFFEDMGSLKVLDLTALNLSSLPTSFRFLTNLQTLCLNYCILENMVEIEALQNLVILCLLGSSMTKLPREIRQLTQLRMLDLSDSGIEVIPPNIISSLTKLEELYMGNTFVNWGDASSTAQNKNASISELRKLPKLTTLELQIRETWMLPRDLQTVFEKLERYKIAIGDVWEWSDIVDGTSKTLMLKLGTNIHLEHGIKALIKGVENLYLDDVDGIQNVVYQLNGEGFPLLKYLHVQNNANMKHIVDSKERTQIHVSFPILETLVLDNLKNLEHICLGPLSTTSFRSLVVIKVKHCVHLKYLFSFTLVKELSHLSEIEVCHCNSMKEIVLGDNNSSENSITNEKFEVFLFRSLTLEHMETLQDFFTRSEQKHQWLEPYISTPFFNAQVSFPNLDTLKLSSLNLGKFWDDNHQSMCNLTSLIVENCGGLKYLFSSTMVGSLNNLKQLEISNCPLMEEIIVKEETNNEIEEDVHFFNLEKITLKDMDKLKTIWHRQFETVKMLQVSNCKKIMVVFPSSMQTTYTKLEMLEVTDCALVEEIFELSFNENSSAENTTLLKVVIDGLPKLKNIWSGDLHRILSFQILIFVKLTNCESLEYLLPLPIATRCSHLQELHIENCGNMKEIVAEENESSVSAAPTFEFNQLTSLSLLYLGKLKGFYAKKHTLTCPSLKEIDVFNCAKLNLFRTLSTRSSNFQDDKLSVLTPQPPFIVEEVIPNLKELKINRKEANVILQAQNSSALFTKMTFLCLSDYNIEDTFPYWFLQNVHTLESLVVEWSCFKKIFQDEGQISEKKTYPQLKKLTLNGLHKLQHICEDGFQIDPVLAFLENLYVDNCSSLLSLLPSSATLNHLEYLEITNCNGLKKLITSPTAQSLHKLISLKVKDCNSLEEIITGEENVGIAFISLELLMLDCLPSLNKFCSSKCFLKFPMLAEVIVRACPGMKIFSEGNTSTPNLQKVKIAENDEWLWKGNLNDTITNIFEDKVAFGGFKHLKLAEYPELKELWYGQPQHNLFRSLKYLVVHRCDFLSEVLFQPNLLQVLMNLEELDITDCVSLEAVFDMKGGEFEKEILAKNSTQLKKLTLSNLPTLKHVWKEDQHNTMGFQNLIEVSVEECPSLKSLFPLSVARDMNQIQTLEVTSCGIEEIVGREEGVDEIVEFVFPNLTSIRLHYLAKLKTFFGGVHSLQCKSLNTINVFGCPRIKLFKAEPLRQQESARNDELNISTYQPLFVIEEVLATVENFYMNAKYFDMILHSQYSGVQLTKVKDIGVGECYNKKATFPYGFLKNVPNLETILVQWSSFREIFQGTEMETQIIPRLKELKLWHLNKLQRICKEGLQMDPILNFLESIHVQHCSNLVKLMPSSVTFNYLTYLEVTNCNGLTNLITYSTAKSLVKLTTMKIEMCNRLEDIINSKGEDEMHKIEFYSLQHLELVSLPRLRLFCSCPCPIMFPLLEVVVVKECPRMEHFSLDLINTTILQNVQFDEEDHWEGELNGTVKKLFYDNKFGGFEQLKLSRYPELKELWYGQPQHNVFRSLKYLVVHKCDFLSEVLFQPNLLQVLMNLEELDITDCDSLEAVFDMKSGEFEKEILVKNSTQLKKLKLSNLPKLMHVWKENQHNTMGFQNLSEVYVEECTSLKCLFPLSVARDMNQIQTLEVTSCGIEEIVGREEGVDEIVEFVFPNLTSIRLHYLAKLKTFFAGVHSLQCKSLKTINLFRCPEIELFKAESLSQQVSARNDELNITTYQPLFVIEEVFNTVESLFMNMKYFDMILHSQYSEVQFNKVTHIGVGEFYNEEATFPHWFLKNVPNLESMLVQWSSFREIFQGEQAISTEMETQIIPRLKKLELWYMDKLQCICKEGLQMDPVLHFLESIDVQHCSSLMKLVPSSVTFNYLTYLEVTNCNGLINLITYSTAKSLVKLTTMKIKMCNCLEDVVKGKEEDEMNKIEFSSLQYLELVALPKLCLFCSCTCPVMFPLLEVVVVKGCPRMEHFSFGVTNTTILQNVQFDEENHWEGDLNGTVKKLFDDKVAFGSFKHLKLSEYPELKELWYGRPQHNVFRSLKYLVVHKCDFLSEVLFQPNLLEVLMNLEELDITDCDSLEAVFDMKDEFEKESLLKNSTRLKKLKLSNLPKLKHVWKEDQHNTMRFQNLSEVSVEKCTSLKSLFPLSVARDMKQIQSLKVCESGIEEIVGNKEGTKEMVKFVFPHLTSIQLSYLAKLKTFFGGVHSLQCKSLKTIDLFRCPNIELFKTEPLRQQESARNDELNISTYQPLFLIEEVLNNVVESLNMNFKYFDMILHSQYSGVQFNKVNFIGVSECYNEEATFPYWFLKNVPNLKRILVEWSSYREIFKGEQLVSTENETQIIPRLQVLELWHLDKLQCICKEGLQMDPVLHFLESIHVQHCSNLVKLMPSSVTFNYLTYLEVTNCNGLTNLITYSTARSLVKLETMKIEMCNRLEDIINSKEEDEMNKTEFYSLKSLELISLPRLSVFCSCPCPIMFPLLEVVVVKGCPRMEHFSSGVTNTTILQNVQFDKENHWEGDLNGTVKKLFDDKEVSHSNVE
ncbi:unnamed protein product [Trifolium pratense]|uniref:Uncharacterized protein n=1 Tax=Trifolium pratense TaxID=57577 RepID=A0ACB0J3I8_TRIPR|nr:unnamed protein product [Trifolium pratense]